MQRAKDVLIRVLQRIIRLYAYVVSPFLGRNCRFHPTCSSYAHQALEQHGAVKGLVLSCKRILKCHPWSKTSWNDPVPERIAWRELLGYKRGASEKNSGR